MITAHCVCTVIQKNKITDVVRTKASEMVDGLALFLSSEKTRSLLLNPNTWVRTTTLLSRFDGDWL